MCEGDLNKLAELHNLSILDYYDYISLANQKAQLEKAEHNKSKRKGGN
jgi:hypothetical protein